MGPVIIKNDWQTIITKIDKNKKGGDPTAGSPTVTL
jgi:hypothetical protein